MGIKTQALTTQPPRSQVDNVAWDAQIGKKTSSRSREQFSYLRYDRSLAVMRSLYVTSCSLTLGRSPKTVDARLGNEGVGRALLTKEHEL